MSMLTKMIPMTMASMVVVCLTAGCSGVEEAPQQQAHQPLERPDTVLDTSITDKAVAPIPSVAMAADPDDAGDVPAESTDGGVPDGPRATVPDQASQAGQATVPGQASQAGQAGQATAPSRPTPPRRPPASSTCKSGEILVHVHQGPARSMCRRVPRRCADKPTCACLGTQLCGRPNVCRDIRAREIGCYISR